MTLAILVMAALASISACRKATTAAAQTASSATEKAAPQPAKPVPAQLPDVLARVNGEPVAKADFDRLIQNMERNAGQSVPAERRDEIFRQALDQLVTYAVLAQETRARNITVSDAEVDARLQTMKAQFRGDDEAFRKAIAERGITEQKMKDDARTGMVIQKMMEAEVASQPPPTDAQAREFYDKNPDKFTEPEAVRASHILIKADQTADAATKKKARAKAEAVLKKAKAGADFAQLARDNSADGSAQQGGDLGFFPRGQMVPAFEQAAFALEDGQISGIVETQFGFHIIKTVQHKASAAVPFDMVSGRIKEFLTEQHKQEKADAFIASLKKKARIEVLI
jgi:peptidyl-prolyl cis-trans isomerase C